MKKILYGICGIGNGHSYRQLPIIEHLAQSHKILIFAYGNSLQFYRRKYEGHPHVKVVEVAVPFYVGNATGLDLAATEKRMKSSGIDYTSINRAAFSKAESFIGKPDLVISDYEPISAQYAYSHSAPLVTIDQQSKFLVGDFPEKLNNCTNADEIARLRLFFPHADLRIACSFFNVATKPSSKEKVVIMPPVLRNNLTVSKKNSTKSTSMLVYLTAQSGLKQSAYEIIDVLSTITSHQFNVFIPKDMQLLSKYPDNIQIQFHGDTGFERLLSDCTALISTAGHTLLSEAMNLNKPVLALPLNLYEQQMNAAVIHSSGFGLSVTQLTPQTLTHFIANIETYRQAITEDSTVLLKKSAAKEIIAQLEEKYLGK